MWDDELDKSTAIERDLDAFYRAFDSDYMLDGDEGCEDEEGYEIPDGWEEEDD